MANSYQDFNRTVKVRLSCVDPERYCEWIKCVGHISCGMACLEKTGCLFQKLLVMGKREASMYVWNGWTLFIGVFPDNQEHAHHLIQISIGLIRDFTLSHGSGVYECRYAMIAPDEPHWVDDHQEWRVLIYVDPETVIGR